MQVICQGRPREQDEVAARLAAAHGGLHRGMLYEPLSSIAAPFFVAITGIQAYRTIPPMLTKTQKYEKKHQRYGI